MRVVCENCGATYKIPDTKLVKAVNKATCRKCGFKMMIQRPRPLGAIAAEAANPSDASTVIKEDPTQKDAVLLEAETQLRRPGDSDEWSDEAPTQVHVPDGEPSPPPKVPPSEPVPRPDTTAPRAVVSPPSPPKDMVVAMVGAFASSGGALLLAVNTSNSSAMRFIGLGVALWGSLTTLFLLVTGSINRQPGNLPMSLGLGTVLALGGAGAILLATLPADPTPIVDASQPETESPIEMVTDLANEALEAADEFAEAAEEIVDAAEEIVEELPQEIVEEMAEEIVEEVAAAADAVAAVVPEVDPDAERRAEEERQRQAEAERLRREEAARNAAPPPPPQPSKMKSIPLSVVDTLIRTNLSIKRCFFQEKQRSGQLPRRVTVRFTVLATGRVSTARVVTSDFQGGPLDQCLGRSFRSIQFPPFDGEALSMTYPFVL